MNVEYHIEVPLSDGTLLAAQLRRPDGSGRHPALVSLYPYRKDDQIGAEFDYANEFFAANGYATLLVDMRGTGGSTGEQPPTFDRREGLDGAEVVEWAAAQEWCDGNVGMWGVSYGGSNSYKTAALKPPSLKAIVPILGPLDLYADYLRAGGCRQMHGPLAVWGPYMIAAGLCPPLHQDADGNWERLWRERLEAYEPYLTQWEAHPHYDEFWESKAVTSADIEVPMWAIGGWRDLFPSCVPQSYMEASGPRKLTMGPWLHTQPDGSAFEAVEYLPEMLRWWERWLKGERNGVDEEPEVRFHAQRPGRWFDAPTWPPQGKTLVLHLDADNALRGEPGADPGSARYVGDPTVGTCAGLADPHGGSGLPFDQAEDMSRSLCFTGPPVAGDTVIAGTPRAVVDLSVEDGADANLVVKLLDVAPDGRASLITTGALNLRRPHGVAGAVVDTSLRRLVELDLLATGYLLPEGHRLGVALATSDFPKVWPTATNPTLEIHWGGADGSRVEVPVAEQIEPATFTPADPDVNRWGLFRKVAPFWRVTRDHLADSVTVSTGGYTELEAPARNGEYAADHTATASVSADRPDGAVARGKTRVTATLEDGRRVEVETEALTSRNGVDAFGKVTLDGQPVFSRRWSATAEEEC